MSASEEVRAANDAFYSAFRAGNFKSMDRVWARQSEATCIHPGWDVLRGRAAVMESWRRILDNPGSPEIECTDAEVTIMGTAAIVTCREGIPGQTARLIATNVFVREESLWCMVHHHAGTFTTSVEPPEPKLDPTLN